MSKTRKEERKGTVECDTKQKKQANRNVKAVGRKGLVIIRTRIAGCVNEAHHVLRNEVKRRISSTRLSRTGFLF